MKKYNEALERAKRFMDVRGVKPSENALVVAKELIGTVFPELKESEDERIWKRLIEQMERWHECALENNVVQDIKDSADAITYLEKLKEQKPVEWSEEDIKKIRSEEYTKGFNDAAFGGELKELSEEDAEMLKRVLETYACYEAKICSQDMLSDIDTEVLQECEEETEWLKNRFKFLRPQPNWKPSEQEKGALRTAIYVLTEERFFPKTAAHLQNILNIFEDEGAL